MLNYKSTTNADIYSDKKFCVYNLTNGFPINIHCFKTKVARFLLSSCIGIKPQYLPLLEFPLENHCRCIDFNHTCSMNASMLPKILRTCLCMMEQNQKKKTVCVYKRKTGKQKIEKGEKATYRGLRAETKQKWPVVRRKCSINNSVDSIDIA